MFFNFVFKNINISFKKFKFFIYNFLNISNYIYELLVYLNFFNNKISFILKKIFFYILNNLKYNNLFHLNYFNLILKTFILNKGNTYKRYNYRAKGKLDIFVKNFCNIFLVIYHG